MLLSCFILLSAFTCDNEPLEGDFDNTNGGNNNVIGDPGGETTGDYWPMAIGNIWTYSVVEDGVTQDNSIMDIVQTETISNNLYYQYDTFFGDVTATDGTGFEGLSVNVYSRKNGGDYVIKVGELTADLLGLYQITQEGYEYIILKDYLDIGGTWSHTMSVETSFEVSIPGGEALPTTVSNYDMQFEILDKDLTIEVQGETYDSVIKVRQIFNVTVQGDPSAGSQSNYIYYFAKDVGVVKVDGTINDLDDGITSNSVQELISYSLN